MTTKKTALVVFDMAGTTVYDNGNVGAAFQAAFKAHGLEIPQNKIKLVMGYRKSDAIRMLLSENGKVNGSIDEKIRTIHETFEESMVQFYESDDTLHSMPDAEETFEFLNGREVKVALNTGFTRRITNVITQRLGWNNHPFIDCIITSDEVPEGRPHPFMIYSIMKQVGVEDPSNVVKVGDTEVDILEGRNASCGLVIGVTTGAYTKEALQQYSPDHILDSLATLRNLLF